MCRAWSGAELTSLYTMCVKKYSILFFPTKTNAECSKSFGTPALQRMRKNFQTSRPCQLASVTPWIKTCRSRSSYFGFPVRFCILYKIIMLFIHEKRTIFFACLLYKDVIIFALFNSYLCKFYNIYFSVSSRIAMQTQWCIFLISTSTNLQRL